VRQKESNNIMGQNKAQRQVAARAKQEAMDVTTAEVGKVEEVLAEQPKAEAKANMATPTTQPAVVSKQQLSVMRLTVALREQRQIEVKPEMLKQDGKFILINIGPTWPVFRIGANGGIVLPDIRSYKEGMDTWVKADELLARQNARDSKKQAAAAPPAQKAPAAETAPKQLATA
jgi:hypothetical protein